MRNIHHWSLTGISLLGLFAILGFAVYFYHSHFVLSDLMTLLTALNTSHAYQALAWFCLIYIFSCLVSIPLGLPLNMFAGLLWGTLLGGLLINVLATLAATLSFFIARMLGHHFLEPYFKRYPRLARAKQIINRYDWQFIFMARINPIVPFSLSNYLFGLIPDLSFKRYIITTIIANLLPCFTFAALGSLFQTFTLPMIHLQDLLLKIGLVFLFLSVLWLLKIMLINKKGRLSAVKETL